MSIYDKRTLEIQYKRKLDYETGVLKHQLAELQKKYDALVEEKNEPKQIVKTEVQTVVESWPISYFSPFGLKGRAKKYGIDTKLDTPKLKAAIQAYEKANNITPMA